MGVLRKFATKEISIVLFLSYCLLRRTLAILKTIQPKKGRYTVKRTELFLCGMILLTTFVARLEAAPSKKALVIFGGGNDPFLWAENAAKWTEYRYCKAGWKVQFLYKPRALDIENALRVPDPSLKAIAIIAHGSWEPQFYVYGTGNKETITLRDEQTGTSIQALLNDWPENSFEEVILHSCFLNVNEELTRVVFRSPKKLHGHWYVELWPEAIYYEEWFHRPTSLGGATTCNKPPWHPLPFSLSMLPPSSNIDCNPDSATSLSLDCSNGECFNVPPDAVPFVDSGLTKMYEGAAFLQQDDEWTATYRLREALRLFVIGESLGADVTSVVQAIRELLCQNNESQISLNVSPEDSTIPDRIQLQPRVSTHTMNLRLSNCRGHGLFIDSMKLDGNLNDGYLEVTNNAYQGVFVNVGGSYDFQLTFNSSNVGANNAGLRTGALRAFVHSTSPAFEDTVNLNISVYVVPNLCFNRAIQIHSGSNFTDVGSQGSIKNGNGLGMNYYYLDESDRFYDGGVFVANPQLNASNTVQGLPRRVSRQLYSDQFLRCVADGVLDSTVGTSPTYYNLFVKSVGTDIEDTTLVWQNIWEQCTHPDSSDFLIQTTRVINVGSYEIYNVAMGMLYDIDITGGPLQSSAGANVGGDSVIPGPDGRFYHMGWFGGNDVAIDSCSPSAELYGFIVIPGSIGNPGDTIGARGAVIYWQEGFGYQIDNNNVAGGDTLAQRYAWDLVGYHSPENLADDTLTGVTMRCMSGNAYRNDLGYLAIAKKVYSIPVNGGGRTVVVRSGLEGLAASMDTAFRGPGETYTVIHVGSITGMPGLMANAHTAIDWYNNHTGLHVGSKITRLKGDLNDDGRLSPADVVIELNYIFLNADVYAGTVIPVCAADINNTGDLSPADIVLLLNGTFLNSGCAYCLRPCI